MISNFKFFIFVVTAMIGLTSSLAQAKQRDACIAAAYLYNHTAGYHCIGFSSSPFGDTAPMYSCSGGNSNWVMVSDGKNCIAD
jgi:hypothetical protein